MCQCIKRFLNRHLFLIDFVSASFIICVCLIVLLPKVHESFKFSEDGHEEAEHQHAEDQQAAANASSLLDTTTGIIAANQSDTQLTNSSAQICLSAGSLLSIFQSINANDTDHHNHHHHHNHNFPTGEVLICIGFFVFYSIGMAISNRPEQALSRRQLMLLRRGKSAPIVCCSSKLCPSGQQVASDQDERESSAGAPVKPSVEFNERTTILHDSDGVPISQPDANDDCVMLLNRHHEHHTHSTHHEHVAPNTTTSRRRDYGAVRRLTTTPPDLIREASVSPDNSGAFEAQLKQGNVNTKLLVDEIRITSCPMPDERDYESKHWPHSLKMLIVCLLLAGFLIFFDMNVQGLMKALKAFRAVSTGALLYVGFFIMMPKNSSGCSSCKEEET